MELGYLFAGFAVFWAGLFAYLLWLQARLRAVSREVERLEERLAEDDRVEEHLPAARAPRAAAIADAEPPPATGPQHTTG